MRIIIDTHIFIWALSDPGKLSSKHRQFIETKANVIYLSSISIAEIMIKKSLGKLKFNINPLQAAEKSGFEVLDFGAKAAMLLGTLKFHHKDPFDRMLIAQSLALNYSIITNDNKFRIYDCKLV